MKNEDVQIFIAGAMAALRGKKNEDGFTFIGRFKLENGEALSILVKPETKEVKIITHDK